MSKFNLKVLTMQVVENQVLNGGTFVLDGKFLLNCHFTGTILLYDGGEVSSKDSRFDNCPIQFTGAAGRTIGLLAGMGMLKPGFNPPGANPPGVTPMPSGKPQ